MTEQQYFNNLKVPKGKIDVVIDTDLFNEVDDQFALSYLLKSTHKLTTKAIYAAPFWNDNSSSPEDGMEKSYCEVFKILKLGGFNGYDNKVFKGSKTYLQDEKTPVQSAAAQHLVSLAKNYTSDNPLYVVAIGAITNIASALLIEPSIKENIVIVWLGGNKFDNNIKYEFNLCQDIAAARVVFACGAPLVILPCMGVVDSFAISGPELYHWINGKNELCNYLVKTVVNTAEAYAKNRVWSRVIWDVTAVAWLLNDDDKYMTANLEHSPIPSYDKVYSIDKSRHLIQCVNHIKRDELFHDLFETLIK